MFTDPISALSQRRGGRPDFFHNRSINVPQDVIPEVFSSRSVSISLGGAAIDTAFPIAKRINRLSFEGNIVLINAVMSSSMLSADGLIGVFAMTDTGSTVNLSEVSGVLLSHIAHPSVSDFVSVPIARSNGVSFERNHAYFVPSGSGLALYAFSSNNVKNKLAVTLSVIYKVLKV